MARGSLFTQDFLAEGITETHEFNAAGESEIAACRQRIRDAFRSLPAKRAPNEAQTEDRAIWPILEALGWTYFAKQQKTEKRGRQNVPDGLLFTDQQAKDAADATQDESDQYRHGAAIVEAKRWNRDLDRKGQGELDDLATPSSQMLNYLSRVDVTTDGYLRWGILTNGRIWRLYFQGARSVSEDFFEIDLPVLVGLDGYAASLWEQNTDHLFKVFVLLFRPAAFMASRPDGRTFLQVALDEGRLWEARVTEALSDQIFGDVFPRTVRALAESDDQRPSELDEKYRDGLKQGALIFLYRLLFILYAENRDLLPWRERRFDDYSLKRLLDREFERFETGDTFASTPFAFAHLRNLFRIINRGDESLGIPPYNGGLFDDARTPILRRSEIADEHLIHILAGLATTRRNGRLLRINYRDLSVQHLGAIYERLLENEVRVDENGRITVVADERARKSSGSYYTNEQAVQLIIRKAVQPAIDAAYATFRERSKELGQQTDRPVWHRLRELAEADPADAILGLKVCDPAMGSGHFLVSLVDVVAQEILSAMAWASEHVDWADAENPYVSPLSDRVEHMRNAILKQADAGQWTGVSRERLDDRQLVRRMVLKRVVHGVDKNPMAVELAKLSLWLHTFTIGAPLSFLDHHLRVGDSLRGEWVRPSMDRLGERGERGYEMLLKRPVQKAGHAVRAMAQIEEMTDTDITQVHSSSQSFEEIEQRTQELNTFLDFMHVVRTEVDLVSKKTERKRRETAVQQLLDQQFGDPIALVAGHRDLHSPEPDQTGMFDEDPEQGSFLDRTKKQADRDAAAFVGDLLRTTRDRARAEHFFHWEPAFPNVWQDWESHDVAGGFDAVIGNPPYVRQENLKAIKPVLNALYTAHHGQADLYVYFFERGLELLKPGGRLSYIVTNKWLRAGYAEDLREMLGQRAWLESVYDFGHAKQFFPEADVFPSIATVRKPSRDANTPNACEVAVIPRDNVRLEDLGNQVEAAAFPLPRAGFTREAWRLEPPEVNALMDKISAAGVPLTEYTGCSPQYGIKTGLNEAFLIDGATRDRLIREDPKSEEVIKPYLRGRDIERWVPDWQDLWMILLKSSSDVAWPWSNARTSEAAEQIFAETYPSVYNHLNQLKGKLIDRQDQGVFWWELRPCSYYDIFEQPKIMYQEMTWNLGFAYSYGTALTNNTAYIIPNVNKWTLAVLNSPIIWWWSWRNAMHGKDEVLRFIQNFVERLPIAETTKDNMNEASEYTDEICEKVHRSREATKTILAWLRTEFSVTKPGRGFDDLLTISRETFIDRVKSRVPHSKRLSAADVGELGREYDATIEPARRDYAEVQRLEREIAALVNRAYGLTEADVELMWRTAPPRMPIDPPTGWGNDAA